MISRSPISAPLLRLHWEVKGFASLIPVGEHLGFLGIVMSGWRPFGNVIVDDVWAWRGGCGHVSGL
jgi:hypothetical protein